MKLYDYYRSTASYRVRIALNLKQLHYEKIPVHLLNAGGEHHFPSYRKLNPQGLVPTLEVAEGILCQSLAIIDYLDEKFPHPALLPSTAFERAIVRMLAQMIACDIHPLNNLRVLNRLKSQFSADKEQVNDWYQHWLKEGFKAIELKLSQLGRAESVCYGEALSLADICLIPQVFNAKRFELSLDEFPLIQQINDFCLQQPAFYQAAPDH